MYKKLKGWIFMKHKSKILKAGLCLGLSALMTGASVFPAYASAGEDPGTVQDSEKVFPDPDSFSYDDVEVNFAKGLQSTMQTSAASAPAVWNGALTATWKTRISR